MEEWPDTDEVLTRFRGWLDQTRTECASLDTDAPEDNPPDDTDVITVSGTLREGDMHTLTEIFRGRGEFPSITRIQIEGGDEAEAMRLGALYRSAHLSIIASEVCGNTCFLWLVGGASRIVSNPLRLGFGEDNPEAIRAYLADMDIGPETLERLAGAFSDETVSVSVEQFAELVGERPGSFDDWVVDQCGSMTSREQEYLQSIHAAGFIDVLRDMQSQDPAREDLAPIIAKYEALASASRGLKDDYKQTLTLNWLAIQSCRSELVKSDQQRIMASLF